MTCKCDSSDKKITFNPHERPGLLCGLGRSSSTGSERMNVCTDSLEDVAVLT